MTVKVSGDILGSDSITMPTTVMSADIYVSGLTLGSIQIQVENTDGAFIPDKTMGDITANGKYSYTSKMPAKLRACGISATGPAKVRMVGNP